MKRRFDVIVSDPPWQFGDRLRMSAVRRGAGSNYRTMPVEDIAGLPVGSWAAPDALLALWVPGSMLADALRVAAAWDFQPKQEFIWVKTSAAPSGLAFGMGRQFRLCSETALICTRGSPRPASRRERNVLLARAGPHSAKPEELQDRLDRMYPRARRLEMFARRARAGWTCVGDECPATLGLDIRYWSPDPDPNRGLPNPKLRCPGCRRVGTRQSPTSDHPGVVQCLACEHVFCA